MPIVCAVSVPHPPIILPTVGQGQEKKIEQTAEAYRAAMRFLADQKPDTVVLISPHAALYVDGFQISSGEKAQGHFERFGAPQTRVAATYNQIMAGALNAEARVQGIPVVLEAGDSDDLDHGSAIPLWFLNQAYTDYTLVRVGLSGLPLADHYRFGECLAAAAGERRVAIVASGDLSHRLKEDGPYGFVPEGPQLDKQITDALAGGDFGALLAIDPALAGKGGECGLRAFVMMAGALDGRAVDARLLAYQDTFGVGYAVATFLPGGADESRHFLLAAERQAIEATAQTRAQEDAWVRLARRSVESWVTTGQQAPLPGDLPAEMTGERAGVFVSLHKFGDLRGCIGTIAPTTGSVAEEIAQNAVSAATQDPRFPPVRPQELDALEIHVDVLTPAEPVNSKEDLDPKRYGVIVSAGGRRGLLLPDLEGIDTVEQQVGIARDKAGIAEDEPVQLERFEVIRHG